MSQQHKRKLILRASVVAFAILMVAIMVLPVQAQQGLMYNTLRI